MKHVIVLPVLGLIVAALPSCTGTVLNACSTNADCGQGQLCDPATNLCVREERDAGVGGGGGAGSLGGGAAGGGGDVGGGSAGGGGGGGAPATGGSSGTGGGVAAPSGLSYGAAAAVYTKGVAIADNAPSSMGGAVVSYAVMPTLPAGLTLEPSTGVISGTPSALSAEATYTVTATNAGGSASVALVITVNDVAPSDLAYATNPAVFTKGVTISDAPSSAGGAVVSYSVSPALPAGLSLDASTGVISGVPSAVTAQATYTLTATNTGGSTSSALVITVNDAPPSHLAYSTNPAVFTKGVAITNETPSSSGGAAVSYSVSPALPAGLSLDTSTGVISGTPSAVAAQATYTVTATNTGGSTSVGLVLTVKDVAPSNLTYSMNPAVFTKGVAVTDETPSSSGGAVVSYSVSPALSAGLTFNTSTGVISGTPSAVVGLTTYTVTATNTGGSTIGRVDITVNDAAPTNLAYSTNPAVYTLGQTIANNTPSSTGGTITDYSVSPPLPAGLRLDRSTGVISGAPTVVKAQATYTVIATNTGGSTTGGLVITVQGDVDGTKGSLAAGGLHTCALVNGGVHCWGGRVSMFYQVPIAIPGLSSGVQAVVSGFNHACALANGGVKCWGSNDLGQLGNDSTSYSTEPVQVQGLTSGVQAIAAGFAHTCATVTNGNVVCWGSNNVGQLGNNSQVDSHVPVAVQGLSSSVQAISLGDYHSCALINGGVQCWGYNGNGQLGNNSTSKSLLPVQVQGLSGVEAVSAGGYHTCALVSGGVQCWGLYVNSSRLVPAPVEGLPSGVQAIASGGFHACALANGGLWCWGRNAAGQLGDNSIIDRLAPVRVQGLAGGVQAVSAGAYHTCALANGGVLCWGYNYGGQLGDGTATDSAVPVRVQALSLGVQALVAGDAHTCALVKGGVQCWGSNTHGQLGNNSTTNSTQPVQVQGLTSGVQAIAANSRSMHSCAIVNGAVKCWGYNGNGQLGNGTTTDSSVPVQVTGLTSGATAVITAASHSCAIVNGGLQCWGYNGFGQLGTNSTGDRLVPVLAQGLSSGVQAITAGSAHTCAVVNGGLQCWGGGVFGQLGNGTMTNSLAPVQVQGLVSGVQALGAGHLHTCALVSGGLQCWGYNGIGELGNNSASDSSLPVQVQGLSSSVQSLVVGGEHGCAILNGGAQCWGDNANGQLGNGSSAYTSHVPVQVQGLAGGVLSLGAGGLHTCAIVGDGVQCWGANASGQLGNGSTTDTNVPVKVLGLAL